MEWVLLSEKLGYDDNLIIIIKVAVVVVVFFVVVVVGGSGVGVVEVALVLVAIEMAFKQASN